MKPESRVIKLLAWCLLICTTGSFASSFYVQWLEGRAQELRYVVSQPMPQWKDVYTPAADDACSDVATPPPANVNASNTDLVAADVRDAY